MKLHTVTITGADDSTNVADLVALSREFPFVEWAILVSERNEGSFRFPTRDWINSFVNAATANKVKVATHMCGRWVRNLLIGELDWNLIPLCIQISNRVQINTHRNPHHCHPQLLAQLQDWADFDKRWIFQFDGVNDLLAAAMHAFGVPVAALFDTSGGAGRLPAIWPSSTGMPFPCGYSGGLGPDNVLAELQKIDKVCAPDAVTWIDMERQVRTPDDSALDLSNVRRVLEQVALSAWIQ